MNDGRRIGTVLIVLEPPFSLSKEPACPTRARRACFRPAPLEADSIRLLKKYAKLVMPLLGYRKVCVNGHNLGYDGGGNGGVATELLVSVVQIWQWNVSVVWQLHFCIIMHKLPGRIHLNGGIA